ncbi:hypothetical protein RFI_01354 [Reticulomyxa filosa]|uniref:RGS domain-containing protein n=1 Tax=Reticulomyxa filosa TaxID=46433 RepID=X6PC07_RETFI|nr:hypothetical protein RFI_01354 [Reticulomyxa filosa]|eukprot:ETO35711.1 hypothetical protein RFI_01354 [Reticulomyxa filosa]
MLFLMESEQFQSELLRKLNSTGKRFEFVNSEGKKVQLLSIQFADSVPKSQIVRHDICDEYKQAMLLFEKYVVDNAPFCINISFKARKELLRQFNFNRGVYEIFDEDGEVISRTKDGSLLFLFFSFLFFYAPFLIHLYVYVYVHILFYFYTLRGEIGTKILMKKFQPQQLVTIFDDARKEIWDLIRDSFGRFLKTEEYHSLLEKKEFK